jgi:phosphoglycolate phosphatase
LLRYNLVIFDFDGTLADSFALFLEAAKVAAERFKFRPIAETDLDRLRSSNAREIIAEVGLPWWKLPAVVRHTREFMRARIEQVSLFDGVDVMLHQLKAQGVQIAIVTSNSQENVERVLGNKNLALIDHLACGASIFGKRSKTRSVLKASGVSAKAVLSVGDEMRDVEVAQALGLDFAAVTWGYTNPDQLARLPGVKMCRSVHDVQSLVIT